VYTTQSFVYTGQVYSGQSRSGRQISAGGRKRVAKVNAGQRTGTARATADRIIAAWMPSLADVLFVCVLCGVTIGLQGKVLGNDGDVAWNLRIGSEILAQGIPRTEFLLSPTLGRPVVYWEWLSQAVYAVALRLGGLNGVVALAALLVALSSVLLFADMRRRAIPLAVALPLALAATGLTSILWTARAQLFTLLFIVLWSHWLWRYWRNGARRHLWVFPASMVAWANLHGGFVAGLILLGTATAVAWLFPARRGNAQPRDLTMTLLVALAATLVNPWGPQLLLHIAGFGGNPLIARYTQDFQSPDFHTLSALLFLALAFALVGAWLWVSRVARAGGPEPLAIAHAAVWTALALYSVRFVPLWALVVTPLLGESLAVGLRHALAQAPPQRPAAAWLHRLAATGAARARVIEALDRQVSRGIWSALALLLVAATVARGGTVPGLLARTLEARFDPTVFPVAAAERLHRVGVPAGRGFTTFAWGGYLDYALPEYHPFIDSRSDAYGQQLFADYASITALQPGWQGQLDRYAIRWALVPTAEPLAQALALAPGWQCTPADDVGVAVLCRRAAAP
jgi:hypothetical protein